MNETVTMIFGLIGGLALFLFGMNNMSSSLQKVAGDRMKKVLGFLTRNPLLGAVAGALVTAVLQSSSATTVMVIGFVSAGLMSLPQAISVIFGANIGTTMTALLASIGQSRNAKRTALAHSFFNISGSVVFAFLIPVFAKFVTWISPKGPEVEVIARQIANAHTTFNVVCTLVWLPLIPIMVKLVTSVVRGQDQTQRSLAQPRYLDEKVLGQSLPAMHLISQEIDRCSEYTNSLLVCARQELEGRTAPEKFDELFQGVKSLQEQIVGYISRLFARGVLNEEQSEITAGLLFVTNNIDRITDRCGEITGCVRQLRTGGHSFSPDASRELEECFTISQDLFNTAMDAIRRGDRHAAQEVLLEKNQMREQQKKYNRSHLERVTRKECDAALTPDYTGILYGLDRIADNCVSIAEEALDQISFVALEQPMVLAGEVEP